MGLQELATDTTVMKRSCQQLRADTAQAVDTAVNNERWITTYSPAGPRSGATPGDYETVHPVRCLDDLERWVEPDEELAKRCRKCKSAKRLTGYPMARICRTMTEKYGVGWAFCAPEDAGREVLAIIEAFDGR